MRMKRGATVLAVFMLVVLMLCAFAEDVDNKDKVAIFNDIEVPAGMTLDGNAVAIFGDVIVNGKLTGDAVAAFGDISTSGTIDGDTVAVFGKVSVKNNGMINGDAVGIFGGVDKAPNGSIRGEIVDVSAPFNIKRPGGLVPRVSFVDVIGLFVIYAFSCLVLLIAPDRVRIMADESKLRVGRHFGIGFMIMLLFIPAAAVISVMLAITVIGIVFIPFIFVAFVLMAFVGMVALEVAIGYRITGYLEGKNSLYIHLLVGVVIVYVLKIIPIIGWLAYLAMAAYAIGIAVDTRLGTPLVRKQASDV